MQRNNLHSQAAYNRFTRQQWQQLRCDEPLTLTADDVQRLKGAADDVSLQEVEQIYLPLSRLLSFYITATQGLHGATVEFLQHAQPQVPFIIGVSGSVAVGKSTTSRLLQALLSRWPHHPNVEIITTDGFLLPNKELEAKGLMMRKGFPESYDVARLISVLQSIKAGRSDVKIPLYSHHSYDVLPDKAQTIQRPDIIILEGLNILQTTSAPISVSDFLDYSIYVDAPQAMIKDWYVERVLQFWQGPFRQQDSYFHFLTRMNQEEVMKFAEKIWLEVNEENLELNILPYKYRAKLILHKTKKHKIDHVWLRKS